MRRRDLVKRQNAGGIPALAILLLLTMSAFLIELSLQTPTRAQTNTVVATVNVGHRPAGVAFDPTDGDIYVADEGSGNVSVIADSTNTVIANVTGFVGPFGVAFDPADGGIYVTNTMHDTVSVIDGSTNAVEATIAVGDLPQGVAFDFMKEDVYVAGYGSDTVSVIEGSAVTTTTITTTVTSTVPTTTTYTTTITGPSTTATSTVTSTGTTTVTSVVPTTSTYVITITGPTTTSYSTGTTTVYSTTTLTVLPQSKLTVACTPLSLTMGSPRTIKCTAKVTGYNPTGSVAWSQSGTGSVSFSSPSCNLVKHSCSVTMTAAFPGTVTVRGTYSGDSNNAGSAATSKLITVKQAKTSLLLSCSSTSKDVWTCTATLKGYAGSVSGESISWSKPSGKGSVSFPSPATCTLSSVGTCSITATGTSKGKVMIEAVYSGDTNNLGSSKTKNLKVT
jgi:YVTN family beta-propeller protein